MRSICRYDRLKSRAKYSSNALREPVKNMREAFEARYRTERGISGKDLVSAQAGQSHLDSCVAGFARNKISVYSVHRRQIHGLQCTRNRIQNICLRDTDLMVIGMKFGCNGARMLSFRKVCLAKHDRERAGNYPFAAQDADESTRIDPAGKKYTHRSEEHTSELQSHSFISYAVFCLKKKK